MKNKALLILLIVVFIKGLVWLFFTPIFQIPDEPSHFAYVQFLAEKNRQPHPRRDVVTSEELFTVSKIVNFNWKIAHPVWRGLPTNWVNQIEILPTPFRQQNLPNPYITSLKRPGLYYSVASLIYRVFGQQSFLWRFFAIRMFSLLCQLIIIWLTYKICQKLFDKPSLSLASAALVSFHPGFSFILSGVSYEALGVLVATLFTYLAVNKSKFAWLILTAFAGILIKPDLIFLLFLLPFCLPRKPRLVVFGTLILGFIGLFLSNPIIDKVVRGQYLWLDKYLYILPLKDYADYTNQLIQLLFNKTIFFQTVEYGKIFIQVHYHQIFAWYWGVFGWLEKTMPPLVYTILKLLTLISLIGLFKAKKIKFLIFTVVLQALIIIVNDWMVFITTNQIYGIQGRYFLPAIAPQMILFTLGLSKFISLKLLITGVVLLNLIGLFTLFQYFGNVWQ